MTLNNANLDGLLEAMRTSRITLHAPPFQQSALANEVRERSFGAAATVVAAPTSGPVDANKLLADVWVDLHMIRSSAATSAPAAAVGVAPTIASMWSTLTQQPQQQQQPVPPPHLQPIFGYSGALPPRAMHTEQRDVVAAINATSAPAPTPAPARPPKQSTQRARSVFAQRLVHQVSPFDAREYGEIPEVYLPPTTPPAAARRIVESAAAAIENEPEPVDDDDIDEPCDCGKPDHCAARSAVVQSFLDQLARNRRTLQARRLQQQLPAAPAAPLALSAIVVHDGNYHDIRATARRATSIKFDVLTEADIRGQSVVTVRTRRYLLRVNGRLEPNPESTLDERMGPHEFDRLCTTCEGKLVLPMYQRDDPVTGHNCPGHFGCIELSTALFVPEFADTLMRMLRSFCWWCGKLPGTDEQNAEVCNRLLQRSEHRPPLNRSQRIDALVLAYGKKTTCQQCLADPDVLAAQRCSRCRDLDAQCMSCANAVQFRPLVRKVHNRRKPFIGFPYNYYFSGQSSSGKPIDFNVDDAFDNFCDRKGIKELTLELTPERVRRILTKMGTLPALLLADELPPMLSAGIGGAPPTTPLERTLGLLEGDAARVAAAERLRYRSVEKIEALATSVAAMSPNVTRGTNLRGGWAHLVLNELTIGYNEMLKTDNSIRAQMRPSTYGGITPSRSDASTDRVLALNGDERWYQRARCDGHLVLALSGRLQYQWALLSRPTAASCWLPPDDSSVKLPDKARRGADRTKHRGRGFMSDPGGKGGLFRKNLEGARTEFSSRSVITPAPNSHPNELLVPRRMAEKLTIPVRLTALNIEKVMLAAEERRLNWVGRLVQPEFFLYNEAETRFVNYMSMADSVLGEQLATIGSTIEVPINDGDWVVFNRQPSLHKPSLMAHRVKMHDGATLSFNEDIVEQYNADFDGDEMTMHVPQSIAATPELSGLMAVQHNVLLAKNGGTAIAPRQNHLLMLNLMTIEHIFVELQEAGDMLFAMLPDDGSGYCRLPVPTIVRPRPLWTARQFISVAMPRNLTLSRTGSATAGASAGLGMARRVTARDSHLPPPPLGITKRLPDIGALIVCGEMMYGVIEKSLSRAIVNAIYTGGQGNDTFGDDVVGALPESSIEAGILYHRGVQRLTEHALCHHGYSFGIDAVMPDHDLQAGAKDKHGHFVDVDYSDAAEVKARATRGPIEFSVWKTLRHVDSDIDTIIGEEMAQWTDDQTRGRFMSLDQRIDNIEARINKKTAGLRDKAHSIVVAGMSPRHSLGVMIRAGVKGEVTNVGEMQAALGQQQLGGLRLVDQRIAAKVDEREMAVSSRTLLNPRARLLPHFPYKYPNGTQGGWVGNSYLRGLQPHEFFFACMATRENLSNTAVGTAGVGFWTRRMIKVVEGIFTAHDGSVRAADNTIIQARACVNPQMLVKRAFEPMRMSDAALAECVYIDAARDQCVYDRGELQRAFAGGARDTAPMRARMQAARPDARRQALVRDEAQRLRAAISLLRSVAHVATQNELVSLNNIDSLLVRSVYDSALPTRHTASSALLRIDECASPNWNALLDDAAMYKWRRSARIVHSYGADRLPQRDAHAEQADFGDTERYDDCSDDTSLLLDECRAIELVDQWFESLPRKHRRCNPIAMAEMRVRLCAKQLVRRHMMSELTLMAFFHCYEGWLRRSMPIAGEAVGIIAAQSLASEGMQMMLSSFHSAGQTLLAVSRGMPRGLELAGARTTAAMATPKVSVYLPHTGYQTRCLWRLLQQYMLELTTPSLAREFNRVWKQQLGRDAHMQALVEIKQRQSHLRCASPPPSSSSVSDDTVAIKKRTSRKRTLTTAEAAARAAEEADEATRRGAFRAGLVAALGEALEHVEQCRVTQFSQTLDSLFENWRISGSALLADVRHSFASIDREQATFITRHSVWATLVPWAGPVRSVRAVPTFDAESNWRSITIVAEAHPMHAKSASASVPDFYRLVRLRRSEMHVHMPSRAATPALPIASAALDAVQRVATERATAPPPQPPSDAEKEFDAAAHAVTRSLTVEHLRRLKRITIGDLLKRTEIVYMPLERISVDDDDDDDGALHVVGSGAEYVSEFMRDYYARMVSMNEGGCINADCDVVHDADRKYAHSNKRVRCLSSFAIILRLGRGWFADNDFDGLDKLLGRILEHLGADTHTAVVSDGSSASDIEVHIRVHTCTLDRLAARRGHESAAEHFGRLQDLLHEGMLDGADDDDSDEQHSGNDVGGGEGNGTGLDAGLAALRQTVRYRLLQQGKRAADMPALIEGERDELRTQCELNELARSLAIVGNVPIVAADTMDARRTCTEPCNVLVQTSESGAEVSEQTLVAVDSRFFLRVMSERIVDRTRCITNAVCDMHDVLGTVAGRNCLATEYISTVESSNKYIHPQHPALLADVQFVKGIYRPFTVHGLFATSDDVLQAATYQESHKMLTRAATRCAVNKFATSSPSSHLVAGLLVSRLGTNASDIVYDEHKAALHGIPQLTAEDIERSGVLQRHVKHKVWDDPFQQTTQLPGLRKTPAYYESHDEVLAAESAAYNAQLDNVANDPHLGFIAEHGSFMGASANARLSDSQALVNDALAAVGEPDEYNSARFSPPHATELDANGNSDSSDDDDPTALSGEQSHNDGGNESQSDDVDPTELSGGNDDNDDEEGNNIASYLSVGSQDSDTDSEPDESQMALSLDIDDVEDADADVDDKLLMINPSSSPLRLQSQPPPPRTQPVVGRRAFARQRSALTASSTASALSRDESSERRHDQLRVSQPLPARPMYAPRLPVLRQSSVATTTVQRFDDREMRYDPAHPLMHSEPGYEPTRPLMTSARSISGGGSVAGYNPAMPSLTAPANANIAAYNPLTVAYGDFFNAQADLLADNLPNNY